MKKYRINLTVEDYFDYVGTNPFMSVKDRMLFSLPEEFRNMVKEMAIRNDIDMDLEELVKKASAWQMRNGTLSGRCAEQFIKHIKNLK